MSALGEYIHLHSENYIKYGTNRINAASPSDTALDAYKAQLTRNKERISALAARSNIQEYLPQLEEYIKAESNSEEAKAELERIKNTQSASSSLAQRFQENLINRLSEGTDYNNLTARRMKRSPINTKTIDINKAIQARQRIYQNINYINSMVGDVVPARSVQTLVKNFNDFFTYVGMKPFTSMFYVRDLKSKNTLNNLKNLVFGFNLTEANAAMEYGQFGERVAAIAGQTLQRQAGTALVNSINEIIKGDQRTTFTVDRNLIPSSIAQAWQEDTGYNVYQVRASQNKIDISVQIGDGESIEASVKAYSTRGNTMRVHIQDIRLISSLLSTANNFANHWINCQVLYSGNANIAGWKNQLDAALVDQMKYEALAAGNLLKEGDQVANVFIAIDTTQGRVFVKTTYDILTQDDSFTLNPQVSNLLSSADNQSDPRGPDYRIAKLLEKLRQNNVKITLRVQLQS